MKPSAFDPAKDYLIAKIYIPYPYSSNSCSNFINILVNLLVECFNWDDFEKPQMVASWMQMEDGKSIEITVWITDSGPSPLRILWVFPKLLGDGESKNVSLDEILGGNDETSYNVPQTPPEKTL